MSDLRAPRSITLFYTQSNKRNVVQSSATVWGDLASEIGDDFSNMKVVIQQSRLTLENTESQLPDGDFTLFLFPSQSKAGISNKNRIWANVKYNELRSLASKLNKTKGANIPMNDGKLGMANGITAYYGGTTIADTPTPKTKVAKLAKTVVKTKVAIEANTSDKSDIIIAKLDEILTVLTRTVKDIEDDEIAQLKADAESIRELV